jgi:thiol-disulfide isomerase/thioredoxin
MEPTFFENLRIFSEKMSPLFFTENDRLLFKDNAASYFALSPGMPAPEIELPDSTGNIVHLSDFKGKVVYIDFWGTWCYPCIQEIPDALKLQEKYKDKPVVFLYVALEYNEKNIAEWKQFIAGKNTQFAEFLNKPFPGVHVVAEKQFRNENIKPYKINFAPTHVLVDQNGNIVNARATSLKDVIAQIDQLLEKMAAK